MVDIKKVLIAKYVFIIFGPPGSGKGTLCDRLVKDFDINHISTGEVLRQDEKFSELIEKGLFVDDKIVNEIVLRAVKSSEKSIILDGYPRNLEQLKFLHENGVEISKAIYLNNSMDISIERMMGRNRSDDSLEVIKNRFEIYENTTTPIISELKELKIPIIEIDSSEVVDTVFSNAAAQLPEVCEEVVRSGRAIVNPSTE